MSPQLDTLNDEVNILYAASHRLTQATTPVEWLEAVSGYARDQAAATGILFYLEGERAGQPEWGDIVAAWTEGDAQIAPVGTRFSVPDYVNFMDLWISTPDSPLFMPDTLSYANLDRIAYKVFTRYKMLSAVILPLNNKGRWVGMLMFTWDTPRQFNERDERIYTAMIQQATPVIDSMRLFDESRLRATRTEKLLKVNTALSQATDELQILDALALYTGTQGVFGMTLNYLDYSDSDTTLPPAHSRTVALWRDGQTSMYDQTKQPVVRLVDFGIAELWVNDPESVLYISNLADDERIPAETRRQMLRTMRARALVIIPLYSGGRYHGVISILWEIPHSFSSEEQYIYEVLTQTLPSVVASRRAYVAEEEARQESELLYRASKAINAASTYDEIVDAVHSLNLSTLSPALGVFENYDFDTASYLDLTAKTRASQYMLNKRLMFSDIPIVHKISRNVQLVVEDTANRDQIDEISAATLEADGVHALIDVPLHQEERWIGLLSFASREPRTYTPLELRLASGVGDMTAAAVERIRLRERSDSSRVRAELLAQVNAALSLSSDEQSILSAVSLLAERHGVSLSTLAYLDIGGNADLRAINIVALRSEDGRSPLPLSFLPVTYFRTEDYPILQVAYDNPDEPTFIEDLLNHSITQTTNKRSFFESLDWHAVILIPLRVREQWQGILTFIWNTPQVFNEEIRHLFTAIRAPASAVVATRRAYVAEEGARYESELLYRASEAINAAHTYQDVVQAVALLDGGTHSINMTIWEHYDFDRATHCEVVATAANSVQHVGQKISITDFPILNKMPRKGLWIIEDMTNDTRIDPVSAANWLKDNVHARIGVPLTLNNRWMGNLAFHHMKPKVYIDLEKRLITGIGDLVTAAVERIRLREQTDKARQRAERLAQVNAALSQATDEWAILSAVNEYLAQLQPDFMTLNYVHVDETGSPIKMTARATLANGVFAPDHPTLNQTYDLTDFPATELWAHDADSVLVINDIMIDDRVDVYTRDFLSQLGNRAMIIIPLFGAGRWQAMIGCSWTTPRPFTASDRRTCESLIQSTGAVVASRRAYLAEESARREMEMRANELETIAKVSAAASSVLEEQELLNTVSYLTSLSFTQYQILIYVLDESGEYLVQATHAAESSPTSQETRISVQNHQSLLARAAQKRQGMIVNDIANAPEYTLMPFMADAQSEMVVPMIVAERLIGALDIQSPEVNRFTQEDIRVMSTLADLIAVAVENARLYQGAQEIAAFEERTRLARELHDSVSQALYGIALGTRTARILYDRDPTQMAEPLDYVMSLAEAALTEMRALIFELRPESLENEGLIVALTKQAESLQARHGVKVQVDMCEEPPFTLDLKEALYRIAREALHNIVKHANATEVIMHMNQEKDDILLEIRDDGLGFDTSANFPGHLGLQSMRERTTRLNGTFTLDSTPGQGTRITVRLPCAAV